uniref:DDE Tnp4 domain-containing protein n=1 Tax=Amphimedon queenslandica TaxID=400682 RepID=A0A1X7UUU6_AMPQE
MTFSNYKNHNTYNVLTGISPIGVVTFVSKLFPGAISDKQFTLKSGLLELLERVDSVMADHGFDIQDQLMPLCVTLIIPAFSKAKVQLSNEELIETCRIATSRIHVERAMERMKNYHILERNIPNFLKK